MSRKVLDSILIVGFAATSQPMVVYADPPGCDRTWDGEYETEWWKDPINWSGDQVPDEDEVACILNGASVIAGYIGPTPHVAKAVYVDSTSALAIWNADILILCGGASCEASQIDGGMTIYNGNTPGQLLLGSNVTINGSGTIKMGYGPTGTAEIDADSGTPTLTIASGIRVEGFGDIKIPIVNNGEVVAEYGTLTLEEGGSGSGVWAAEEEGHLHVLGEVDGDGSWELTSDVDSEIEIDAACECLTGDVVITAGTLDVDANFQTEGQLTFGTTDALIDVAATKSAKFSRPNSCGE